HLDPFGQVDRRARGKGVAFAHPVVGPVAQPVGGARAVRAPGGQVVDADVADRATVQVRLLRHAHQRRIAAVAGAGDADALRVGDTFVDRPAGGVGQVVLHLAAPLLCAQVAVADAVISRAAEVQAQHRITGGREHLGFGVEIPAVVAV